MSEQSLDEVWEHISNKPPTWRLVNGQAIFSSLGYSAYSLTILETKDAAVYNACADMVLKFATSDIRVNLLHYAPQILPILKARGVAYEDAENNHHLFPSIIVKV